MRKFAEAKAATTVSAAQAREAAQSAVRKVPLKVRCVCGFLPMYESYASGRTPLGVRIMRVNFAFRPHRSSYA
jgi:hypothetical protein